MKTAARLWSIPLTVAVGLSLAMGADPVTTPNASTANSGPAATDTSSAPPQAPAPLPPQSEAAPPKPPPQVWLSHEVKEIAKLSQAGIDASIIEAYIQKSTAVTAPSAGELIYLHDNGVSSSILVTLIQRAGALDEQRAQPPVQPPPSAPSAQPVTAAPANPSAPNPVEAAPEVYTSYIYSYPFYPSVDFSIGLGYPVYAYSACAWPYAYYGWGWPGYSYGYACHRRYAPVHHATYRPPPGHPTYRPPPGHPTYRPPADRPTYRPPTGQATYRPPAGRTAYRPPAYGGGASGRVGFQQPAIRSFTSSRPAAGGGGRHR